MPVFINVILDCGTRVKIFQRQRGVPWEFVITPKPRTTTSDFARIVDNELRINMSQESALGLYESLGLMVKPFKKQKFLGLF